MVPYDLLLFISGFFLYWLLDCLKSWIQSSPSSCVVNNYSSGTSSNRPTQVNQGTQTTTEQATQTDPAKKMDSGTQTSEDFDEGPLILHPSMYDPLLHILAQIDAETAMNLALTCREFYNLIVTRKNLKFPYLVHVLVELPANGVAKFKFLTHDERKAQKKRSNLPSWDDDYEKYDYIGREKYSYDSANAIYRKINCVTTVKTLVISEGYDRTFSEANFTQMMQYLKAMGVKSEAMGVKSVESLFIDLRVDCWREMNDFIKKSVTVLVKSKFDVPAFVIQTIFQLPLSTVDLPEVPSELFLETAIPSVERARLTNQEQLSSLLEKATTSSTFKFFAVDTSFRPFAHPFFWYSLPFDAPAPLPQERPLLFDAIDEDGNGGYDHFLILRADGKILVVNEEPYYLDVQCKEMEREHLPFALREI